MLVLLGISVQGSINPGTFPVCLAGTGGNVLATCSSRRRYKESIQPLGSGLNLTRNLRRVTFEWKEGRVGDLGLIAEDETSLRFESRSRDLQGGEMKGKVKSKKEKVNGKKLDGPRRLPSLVSLFLTLVSLCLCVSAVSLSSLAQSGGTFTITKSVIAGGGGRSTGGTFTIDGTIGQPLAGGPLTGGTFRLESGFWGSASSAVVTIDAPFDFDGDGKTDIGIFRPSVAEWWISRSSNGLVFATQFGETTDVIVPGDYTGDGKADVAVWRPSNGTWFVLRSEDFSFFAFPFGTNGDVPSPGDFDADGRSDAAVFRPSSATWFIRRSSDGGTTIVAFGANGDVPVSADYDGDGRADISIFRPGLGQWWLNRSTAGLIATTFGGSSDNPVQGDYTGDGKADIAFWRPSTGEWFVLRSENFSFFSFPFGTAGDIAAPGDYDGDGRHDATIFRPSNTTWYSQRTTAGVLIQQFGASGDRPIANAFVP